jgi:hypothetical protein
MSHEIFFSWAKVKTKPDYSTYVIPITPNNVTAKTKNKKLLSTSGVEKGTKKDT